MTTTRTRGATEHPTAGPPTGRRRWRRAAPATIVAAAMVSTGLALAPAASAVPSLSATGTSVTTVSSSTTTTLAGYSFSNAQSGDTLQVTISTDVGTLNLPTTTGLTLAFGYTTYSGATISFTGNQANLNADLPSLQLLSGPNQGKTAHITMNAFTQQQNLTYSAPNQHFYEYVPAGNVTWTAAATAAANKTYGGLQGYIATIPNDAVNNFVGSKIQGATNVWFGARSYSNTGGYARLWKWYAGPLVGQTVSACTAATGACSFSTGTDGLNGNAYSHWASGEPNNAGSTENSAVTNWSGSVGNWNDLADSSNSISGYLVEYGDLATGYTVAPAGTASVSNSITITGPPSAPVGPTASLSGTTATVSWTAPTNSGYGTVSGYTVTASPGGATCTPSPATATSCQIGGLTKGTAYTFAVTATNEFGAGAAATTAAVTPRSVPGAPTAAVSGHGNGSLQLSIIPPGRQRRRDDHPLPGVHRRWHHLDHAHHLRHQPAHGEHLRPRERDLLPRHRAGEQQPGRRRRECRRERHPVHCGVRADRRDRHPG